MSTHPLLSPEARLVFRTAAHDVTASEWVALARQVRDWPRVFALAEHQVASLALYRALQAAPEAQQYAPEEFLEALRRVALESDLRMQQLAKRAAQSVAALRAGGVEALLLKGAALGALYDSSFRSRPMTDIDLLVRRSDVARASAALLGTGWKVTENPVYLEMLQDAHHLPHFVDPALPGLRLELHVSPMPDDQPFGISDEKFWTEAVPASEPFHGALVSAPEHLLMHTVIHFAWQHTLAFGAWRTFRAIQLLVADPSLDWDRFIHKAERTKSVTCAYWSLRLAHGFAGIAVPSGVLSSLAPPTPASVRNALERHFVALNAIGERPSSPSIKLTRYLWYAALRPRWSGHANPGRWDPENKWAKAYGTASSETTAQRYLRHMRHLGAWARFVRQTLLG